MKPHREAELSFGKMLLIVGALIAGAGMSGAFGDGTSPPPDLSKLGNLFDAPKGSSTRDRGDDDEPAGEPKRKKPTKKALKMCPDDPYHCWWQ